MYEQDITRNAVQNPYREFTLTIAAGTRAEPIYYNFSYFRVLTLSGTGLAVNFSGSGQDTAVIGAGIGIELPVAVEFVSLINTSGASLTVTIGLSMGRIFDDRLSVSGSVTVTNTISTPLNVTDAGATLLNGSDVTIATVSQAQISGSSTTAKKKVFINNPVGNPTIRIGATGVTATTGFALLGGQSIELNTQAAVFGFNPSGASITINYMEVRS